MKSLDDISPAELDTILLTVAHEPEPDSYSRGLRNIMGGSERFRELLGQMESTFGFGNYSGIGDSVFAAGTVAFNLGWRCADALEQGSDAGPSTRLISFMHVSSKHLDELLLSACKTPEDAFIKVLTKSCAFKHAVVEMQEGFDFPSDAQALEALLLSAMTTFNLGWKCRAIVDSEYPEWSDAVKIVMRRRPVSRAARRSLVNSMRHPTACPPTREAVTPSGTVVNPQIPSRVFDWAGNMVGMVLAGFFFHLMDSPKTALEVFESRTPWKGLPAEFQTALAEKLHSPRQALRFAKVCERAQILDATLDKLGAATANNPEFAIGAFAWSLSSLVGSGKRIINTTEARRALQLAHLLTPRRPILWYSLAVWSSSKGACDAACFWADKVLSFESPDVGAALAQEHDLVREMARKVGDPLPDMVPGGGPVEHQSWDVMVAQMRALKHSSQKGGRGVKQPFTGATLGFLLGPLGYLYIGWRFMLASTASLLVFLELICAAHLPSPWKKWWVGPVVLLVLAMQAYAACRDTNETSQRYSEDHQKRQMADFSGPVGMAVGLFFLLSEAYLAALAISLVAGFAVHGKLLKAGAYLLGGMVAVWLARGVGSVLAPVVGLSLCVAYGKLRGWP